MANNQQQATWTVGGVLLVVFCVLALIIGMLDDGSSSSSSSTPRYERSAEFDYSYGQFRDSGMNQQDSAEAARAVTKFVEAQQRQRQQELNSLK